MKCTRIGENRTTARVLRAIKRWPIIKSIKVRIAYTMIVQVVCNKTCMLSNVVGRGNSIFFLFPVVTIYRINMFSKMKNYNYITM
jgi:hypothetical protein